jgi:hypothetical protein
MYKDPDHARQARQIEQAKLDRELQKAEHERRLTPNWLPMVKGGVPAKIPMPDWYRGEKTIDFKPPATT